MNGVRLIFRFPEIGPFLFFVVVSCFLSKKVKGGNVVGQRGYLIVCSFN